MDNPIDVSINQIKDAAARVTKFIDVNNRLPRYVKIGNQEISIAQYLYLVATALKQGLKGTVTVINVDNPDNSTVMALKGNIKKNEYLSLAKRVSDFIESYEKAPNFATFKNQKISFEQLVALFSKAIANNLPSYISLEKLNGIKSGYSAFSAGNPLNYTRIDTTINNPIITVSDILDAAARVKKFIDTNQRLPKTIKLANQQIKPAQFLYLACKVITGDTSALSIPNMAEAINGDSLTTITLPKDKYVDVASKVIKFMDTNGKAPNFATVDGTKIYYKDLVYMAAKILNFYKDKNRLPNYVTIDPDITSRPENTPYRGEDISQYLRATANCQVNDPRIQSLAKELTANAANDWEKASNIFNWVRDNIDYSFYYNTMKGAVGTLLTRKANCCDHAHLCVALFRAAGLPARYVHGYCQFVSGNWYGHVWAEVLINGVWYAADATAFCNSLGVVKNWNPTTATIYGRYASLPF